MSLLDGILGQVAGGGAASKGVGAIAQKLGIDPSLAALAVTALGAAHDEPGDTVQCAAQKSGIDRGTLASVVEMLGGEAKLGEVAGQMKANPEGLTMITKMLDRNGDGSAIDDIVGMAGKFFKK